MTDSIGGMYLVGAGSRLPKIYRPICPAARGRGGIYHSVIGSRPKISIEGKQPVERPSTSLAKASKDATLHTWHCAAARRRTWVSLGGLAASVDPLMTSVPPFFLLSSLESSSKKSS
ncbi:hypothetical protein MAPG_06285 [Magnaporthiopsis poae ATCC 64411]|uniref:Uncharacterized protein n=1 Tax=Magnaporthiopsis poae (strain ATCC 64411 / 73-15) TaxID=644358 RepID=A0A0C4E1M0_MAGP6|nr:hypothetical protein MAPG_06285 [Magnaporthiopsis poae ATCC 64411]